MNVPFDPDWVVCPGELVRECMEHAGIDELGLAGQLSLDSDAVDELLVGQLPLNDRVTIRTDLSVIRPQGNALVLVRHPRPQGDET